MDTLRLNRKDWLFISVCLLILAGGTWVGVHYFYRAFPEASIQFRYNKSQTEQLARSFLSQMESQPPRDFRHAGIFGYDNLAKLYLEKELGVEKARSFLGQPVRLWYWGHRWFKPATKEEFVVQVSPEGEVIRFTHEIEENAEGADLTEDQARRLAGEFLFGLMHQDSGRLSFVESQRIGRPHRSDWLFTWKAAGIEPVKGSDYRYQVGIAGDRIGSYREHLRVPEAWTASFSRLRSFNELAGTMASIGLIATALAMVVVVYLRMRRKDIQWRTALIFGAVSAVLVLLNAINELPINLYGYDTTSPWSGFLISALSLVLLGSLGAGVLIFLLTAAAETLYREKYPEKLAIPRMFSVKAMRTKSAFKSLLLGMTMTAFFFAYQIGFYLIAGKYGAWSPSDVPYDDLLNTAMPWLAVLFVGFFPAVSEEFISRAFSIPLLQKLFRNRFTWLAVFIPAVIWGFGHSTYPNEPFWIRGAEVGIAGLLIGVIMLKWGILAALAWHYTVDAFYTAILLFRSDNPYFILTAAVATGLLVIPLLLAVAAYIRKGTFLPEGGVLNADIGTRAEVAEQPAAVESPVVTGPVTVQYRPLPRNAKIGALLLLAAGIGAALIPAETPGSYMGFPVSKQAAIKTVADSLRSVGWANPDTLKMGAFVRNNNESLERDDELCYLLKHSQSVAAFNDIAENRLGYSVWMVRAWQNENRLRYTASVNSRTGKIQGMNALLPEELPGDSLTAERAKQIVDSILVARGEDLSTLELKDQRRTAKPHRLDYGFSYEAPTVDRRNIAQAKYRRDGLIQGFLVSVHAKPWYKIPEDWARQRIAVTPLRAVIRILTILLTASVIVWAATLLAIRAKRGAVPWKKLFLLGIIPAGLALLGGLNQFYLSQTDYFYRQIETPWSVFKTTIITIWLTGGFVAFLLFSLMSGLISGLYPRVWEALGSNERRAAWRDALLASASAVGAMLLARSVIAILEAGHPAWIALGRWGVPDWLAAPLPLTQVTADIPISGILLAGVAALGIYLWTGPMRKPWQRIALVLSAVLILMPSAAIEPAEWAMGAVAAIIQIGLAIAVLKWIIGDRPVLLVAAAAAIATVVLVEPALGSGNGPVVMQGWIAIITATGALLLWLIAPLRREPKG